MSLRTARPYHRPRLGIRADEAKPPPYWYRCVECERWCSVVFHPTAGPVLRHVAGTFWVRS